jgi:hypothetical protein
MSDEACNSSTGELIGNNCGRVAERLHTQPPSTELVTNRVMTARFYSHVMGKRKEPRDFDGARNGPKTAGRRQIFAGKRSHEISLNSIGLGWPMLRLSPLTSSTSKNANHPLNSNSHNAHICVIHPTHNLSYHVYIVKLRPARYARARTCACVEQVH